MILAVVTIIVSGLWVASFLRGLHDLMRTEHLAPAEHPDEPQFVSVIVPARNEEENIEQCVRSLLAMDYPCFEVVVADDHSSDRTASIVTRMAAADDRLRLVDVPDLPAGWTGKNWAVHSAVANVSHDTVWFMFTDADTVHEKQSLSTTMRFAEERGLDMLSLYPKVVCETFWEKALLPNVGAMITLFNSPTHVNDRLRRDDAFANGQYILIRRDSYAAAGGNDLVKNCVLEDVALARNMKHAGFRIYLGYGERLFGTRMYRRFPDFVEGWTKNIFLILDRRWTRVASVVLLSIGLSWIPLLSFAWGVASLAAGVENLPAWHFPVLLGAYPLAVAFQMTLRKLGRAYPLHAFLAPIGSFVTSWLVIRSAALITLRRGVTWKGRRYVEAKPDDGPRIEFSRPL
ncbi:MAG: glycosyltransferase [Deltaproteobacteria bacterium]|nr:glycosyltransferase [Deltaproteobacteria bacterium]